MENRPSILNHLSLARLVAERFSTFPQVEAIALGGSLTSGVADRDSDIDIYVYTKETIPLVQRATLIGDMEASQADLDLQYWDLGDEWYHAESGIEVDMIYWPTTWIEEQINRVLKYHQASIGYTTCFWNTILHSIPLFDQKGWFHDLQSLCQQPYPEELQRAIISKNHAVLRQIIPSYRHQIQKAIQRKDTISINHRVAALLASYFDIVFALNTLPNPGEKRVLEIATKQCKLIPENMNTDVSEILLAAAQDNGNLLGHVDRLIDRLDAVLEKEG
jgi:predicted nucleotidyltransferase